ncbi:DoxX family protein [Pedobacter polysacchareus]|uniref:DoxX family protein n=1 Tax=Pedobacter polysacchareus TaxID=2861973 RepID=UPI0021046677|nr:DoxX family protein [Pedobacter polysacchareus]
MASTGAVQLGYPLYFLTLLGIWKILGVITVLIPKFPLLKEWAYAVFSLRCQEQYFHSYHQEIHCRKYCHPCYC